MPKRLFTEKVGKMVRNERYFKILDQKVKNKCIQPQNLVLSDSLLAPNNSAGL